MLRIVLDDLRLLGYATSVMIGSLGLAAGFVGGYAAIRWFLS